MEFVLFVRFPDGGVPSFGIWDPVAVLESEAGAWRGVRDGRRDSIGGWEGQVIEGSGNQDCVENVNPRNTRSPGTLSNGQVMANARGRLAEAYTDPSKTTDLGFIAAK